MAEVAHGSLAIELGESSCSTPDDASEMAVSALCHGLRGLSTTVPSGSVRLPLRQLLEDVRIASSLAALKLRAPSPHYRSLERKLWMMLDTGSTEATPAELLARMPDAKRTLNPIVSARQRGVSPFSGLSEADQASARFERCFAIGPVRARQLGQAGFRSVEEVLARDELERTLDKDGERLASLTAAQRSGLVYYRDVEQYIHRAECAVWERQLKEVLAAVDARSSGELLGSYARGEDVSSDLDLVLRHEAYVTDADPTQSSSLLSSVASELGKRGLWRVTLAQGAKVWRGLVKLPDGEWHRRIDISLAPYHAYACRLVGHTGDTALHLRTAALRKGLKPNDNGLHDRHGAVVPTETERDVFRLVGVPFLHPHERRPEVYGPKLGLL